MAAARQKGKAMWGYAAVAAVLIAFAVIIYTLNTVNLPDDDLAEF
jgi:hypothetical protein